MLGAWNKIFVKFRVADFFNRIGIPAKLGRAIIEHLLCRVFTEILTNGDALSTTFGRCSFHTLVSGIRLELWSKVVYELK